MDASKKDQHTHKRRVGLFLWTIIAILLSMIITGVIHALFFKVHTVIMIAFDDKQCWIESASDRSQFAKDGRLNGVLSKSGSAKSDFDLKWIHSVEKQWWIEAYQVKELDDAPYLLLTDTYLQTFGAGTPSTETIGEPDARYPNYTHYVINTALPYLNWMISSNIKAQIIVNPTDKPAYTLPIYQWVDDYTNIYIAPQNLNLWNLRRQESCYEHTAL